MLETTKTRIQKNNICIWSHKTNELIFVLESSIGRRYQFDKSISQWNVTWCERERESKRHQRIISIQLKIWMLQSQLKTEIISISREYLNIRIHSFSTNDAISRLAHTRYKMTKKKTILKRSITLSASLYMWNENK